MASAIKHKAGPALRMVANAASGSGVTPLAIALSSCMEIMDLLERIKTNKADIESLRKKCNLLAVLASQAPDATASPILGTFAALLSSILEETRKFTSSATDRRLASRIWTQADDRTAIDCLNKRLGEAIEAFQAAGMVDTVMQVQQMASAQNSRDGAFEDAFKLLLATATISAEERRQILQEHGELLAKIAAGDMTDEPQRREAVLFNAFDFQIRQLGRGGGAYVCISVRLLFFLIHRCPFPN